MLRRIFFAVFSLLFSVQGFANKKSFEKVTAENFELLEGKGTSFWKHLSREDQKTLRLYKKLYLKNFSLSQKIATEQKIPKTLHYIWLGPKSFPAESVKFVESWIQLHPDWVVKFWTDQSDRAMPCGGMEKHLISELSFICVGDLLGKTDNWGEKSDLLRYEILFQEGGVYLDHDIECYHNFDPFTTSYDFFAGLEPPHKNVGIEGRVFPCNAIIGAKPKHPVLASTLQLVKDRWDSVQQKYPDEDARTRLVRVINRTFHSFTLATRAHVGEEGNVDIVLPASFFYPDRIMDEGAMSFLKSRGLVWTSHKCVGIWKEPGSESGLLDIELKMKKSQDRLMKKLKRTKRLLYGAVALNIFLLSLYLKQKRRKGLAV